MVAPGISVIALGASTAVGRNAWSSAAAVRAGVSGVTEHPYMIDTAGEPMRVALAPWLDMSVAGIERFEALLLPAIDDALLPAIDAAPEGLRVALALGLPAPRPGLPEDLEGRLKRVINGRYPGRFVGVAAFANGHAAGLLALDAAVRKLGQGAFDACVVAGVDSYIVPETLEWLEENDQLHGAGPLNNAWGFIPGEAAGAALVVTEEALAGFGFDPLGAVLSVGTAVETNRIKTKTVCTGQGLTTAFLAGLAGLPRGAKITDIVCDMNGEPYRADEFGFAYIRTRESFVSASDFVAAADCWGDVSAASVPLAITLSTVAARKAYANGPYAFLWASSEGGERGAALLAVPESVSRH